MYFLMLLVYDVNIGVDVLPPWLEAIGRAVPLTHGIQAARATSPAGRRSGR